MEDQKLKDYFKFDESDLQANRNGQFSEKQQAHFVENDKSSRRNALTCGILVIVLAVIGSVGLVAMGQGLVFGLLWLLAFGGTGIYYFMINRGKQPQFKLAKVQGAVNIIRQEDYSSQRRTRYVNHELHIGSKEFGIQENLANVMMQGDMYAAYYYVGDDGQEGILSAELISKAK